MDLARWIVFSMATGQAIPIACGDGKSSYIACSWPQDRNWRVDLRLGFEKFRRSDLFLHFGSAIKIIAGGGCYRGVPVDFPKKNQ
jgi:hypothetical protein